MILESVPVNLAEETTSCPTARKVVQQRSVECVGHAGARSKAWPSTAAAIVPRRNVVFVPLESDFQGQESGIVPVQRLFHYNIIHAQVTLRTFFTPFHHHVTSHQVIPPSYLILSSFPQCHSTIHFSIDSYSLKPSPAAMGEWRSNRWR